MSEWTVLEAILLAAAGFAAAAVNAVAGGGTLISFPTLVAVGYSAKVANVTNTVGIWPGYVERLRRLPRRVCGNRSARALLLFVPAVIGALVGGTLLLATSEDTFEWVAPFLILFAAALMHFKVISPSSPAEHRIGSRGGDHVPPPLYGAIFLTGIYGAYFGGGLGIINFAILMILLPDDMQRTNALKTLLSLVVNGVAAVYFALFGPVAWGPALAHGVGRSPAATSVWALPARSAPVWLRRAVIAFAIVSAIAMLAT